MKALIFPGQGSQAVLMGKNLYTNSNYAKDVFENVSQAISQDIANLCFNGTAQELTDTANSQVAIFTVSMAVLNVLQKEFNVNLANTFAYTAGHSLGEYTALCAAQALDIASAAKLLKTRGLAMKEASNQQAGAMCAVLGMPDTASVQQAIDNANITSGVCVVANNNSIGQVVVSGNVSAIDDFITYAKANSIKTVKLPVSGAFHSPLMQPAVNTLQQALSQITFNSTNINVVFNVTATNTAHTNIPTTLLKQVTGQVKWVESVEFMVNQGVNTFVECGHGSVLTGLIKRINPNVNRVNMQEIEDIEAFVKTL